MTSDHPCQYTLADIFRAEASNNEGVNHEEQGPHEALGAVLTGPQAALAAPACAASLFRAPPLNLSTSYAKGAKLLQLP